MAIEYFCCYHSYLDAMEELNDAEKGRLFVACLEYSKSGVAPELRGNERFVFPAFRSQIDRDNAKYGEKCRRNSENAKKRTLATADDGKRTETKPAKEKEKEKEKDNSIIPPTPLGAKALLQSLLPEYTFADSLSAKIADWVAYKQERKEGYKEQGLKSLLTQIQKNALKYGDAAVIDLIDLSMSNGWKGIIWDKLAEPQRPTYGKKEIPKGASGVLGDAELEAIQRVLRD